MMANVEPLFGQYLVVYCAEWDLWRTRDPGMAMILRQRGCPANVIRQTDALVSAHDGLLPLILILHCKSNRPIKLLADQPADWLA